MSKPSRVADVFSSHGVPSSVKDGLVKREIFPEVPLRVEYSLTEFGKTLIPVLNAVAKWGRELGETKGRLEEVQKP